MSGMFNSKFALVLLVAATAACGDDEGGGEQRPNQPAAAAAPVQTAAQKAAALAGRLQPRKHVEEVVVCPVPDAPTGHPACTPPDQGVGSGAPAAGTAKMLPDCDPGTYCTQVQNTWSCEPCEERETIRHEFTDRDFVAEQSRDPFENPTQPGVGQGSGGVPKQEPHQSCKRPDQFVATNYSYQDLKLVGIVAQGVVRKVLMMDTGNLGHIIKRGDCVGKEKAVVKDIGMFSVTFVVEEDPDTKRPATETSVQLHPGGLEFEPPPTSQPTPVGSAVAPPTGSPVGPGKR